MTYTIDFMENSICEEYSRNLSQSDIELGKETRQEIIEILEDKLVKWACHAPEEEKKDGETLLLPLGEEKLEVTRVKGGLSHTKPSGVKIKADGFKAHIVDDGKPDERLYNWKEACELYAKLLSGSV